MQQKLRKFWSRVGEQYCTEKDFKYVREHNAIQAREYEVPSLLILNIDDSTSMHWKDFKEAVKGAQTATKFLRDSHSFANTVDVQIWYNCYYGVSCTMKDTIDKIDLESPWESPHYPRNKQPPNKKALEHTYLKDEMFKS